MSFKKKEDDQITLSRAELRELVAAEIAEREAKAKRDAEEAATPKPPPIPRSGPTFPPRDPEREAAFLRAFDENDHDLDRTVSAIYAVKELFQHVDRWRRDPVNGQKLYGANAFGQTDQRAEPAELRNYILHLDQIRHTPSIREQVAERLRLEEGIRDGDRYWQDAAAALAREKAAR